MQGQIVTKNRAAKPVPGKKSYSVAEIQQILGVSRPTAYNLIKQNLFQSVHMGGSIRIIKASFDSWLDASIIEGSDFNGIYCKEKKPLLCGLQLYR